MTWASKYLHVPFVDGGRDWKGADCWGLLRLIYAAELGIELPSYGHISAEDTVKKEQAFLSGGDDFNVWRQVTSDPDPFDVVVMRVYGSRHVGHCGVVTNDGQILHSDGQAGPCIVPFGDITVRNRVLFIRRHHSQCN